MIAREPVSRTTIGHWQPYPDYKDSGIEWLGEIPNHWKLMMLKHAARLNPESLPETTKPDYEILYIDIGNVDTEGNILDIQSYLFENAPSRARRVVRHGDTIVSTVRTYLKAIAYIDNPPDNLIVSTGFAVLRPAQTVYPEYMRWLTQSEQFVALVVTNSVGVSYPAINPSTLGSLPILLPSLPEQRAIAAFLDRETTRIDRLIAAKERLIALLQEKRMALISHAVTKGLDPTVPMKDSGVEWLGEIPAQWEVKRLKFIAQVRSGVAKGRDLGERSTIMMPYLRVANVQAGFLDLSDVAEIEVGVDEIERYSLQPGDVLMNEGGDYDKLGRGTVWYGQIAPCLHQNHVFSVRPNNADASEWIATVTLADYAKHYFILKSKQSTNLASISSSNLQDLPIVMPPAREQQAILSFIRTETDKIDRLINKIAEGNVRLQEFRSALITAAVIGKINVSNILAADRPTKSQTANVHFRRAVFAAEIVSQLHQEPTFGHVKFQKLLFLAENTCKVDIGSQYHRAAAGPYDNQALRSIDAQLRRQQWFGVRQRKSTGYCYTPMAKAGGHRKYFDRYYSDIADRLQWLINTFRHRDTDNCEIVATLYAAWKDLLDGENSVTDEQIVREAINWHESKKRFAEQLWHANLKWMREIGLTPVSAY